LPSAAEPGLEKIMSEINDTSKLGLAAQDRELRDDELQEVSGGRDVRKGGAIIVYDYEGSASRGGTSKPLAFTVDLGSAET
jgi:hypothetical protein